MYNLLPLETEYSVIVFGVVFGIDITIDIIGIDITIDIIGIDITIKYVYYKLFLSSYVSLYS